jgi:hypothetical protein
MNLSTGWLHITYHSIITNCGLTTSFCCFICSVQLWNLPFQFRPWFRPCVFGTCCQSVHLVHF